MWSRLAGEAVAEFLGTLLILVFGAGAVAMVLVFGTGTVGEVVHGGYTNVTIGWALGVMFGVAASMRISGAHLNPAVTLAVAAFRGFPWRKVPLYMLSQTAGAMAGAALVWFNYREAILRYDPLLEKSAGIFTTFPAFPDIPAAGFYDQVLGTALLLFLVFALTDEHNLAIPQHLLPAMVGLVVLGIGVSFGKLHGYAINPARDFGPRLWTVIAGYRVNGLTDGSQVWWVPVAGPLLGALLGAGLYDLTIRKFLRSG